jgi:hypothetical protein
LLFRRTALRCEDCLRKGGKKKIRREWRDTEGWHLQYNDFLTLVLAGLFLGRFNRRKRVFRLSAVFAV